MREIKFRGKSIKTGDWIYGSLDYNKAKGIAKILSYNEKGEKEKCEEVNRNTIGQLCSSLKRKDGKIYEVYTGDILQIHDTYSEETYTEQVDERGAVGLTSEHEEYCIFVDFLNDCDAEWEVIGNIHDNPEFLKKDDKNKSTI